MRAEPPCASSSRASVVATRRPRWTTTPVQRTVPVSTVSARVKFDFTSSVVQPAGSASVVTNASPIAESISVIARPAWTMPIGL